MLRQGARHVRAGPAPRAAAPGTDPDRPQARLAQPPAAGLSRAGDAAPQARRGRADRLGRVSRGPEIDRPRGGGFAFDNERPRHQVYLDAFRLADRLVTNREYLAFMEDGGYERPELWLSDGWIARNRTAGPPPLLGSGSAAGWRVLTLAGMRELDRDEPVCHVSFLRGRRLRPLGGRRLPTEAEWEIAATAARLGRRGNFLETGAVSSGPARDRRRKPPPALFPSSSSAMSGSGPRARTLPIRASARPRALWANTTASSCATRLSCGAARAPRPGRTSGRPTATSFPPRRAGSSRESGWPGTSDGAEGESPREVEGFAGIADLSRTSS